MFAGIAAGSLRYLWEWLSPSSFHEAGSAFVQFEPYIPHHSTYPPLPPSPHDFSDFIMIVGFILFFVGAFIFLRRGFWWVAEHRPDGDSITDLNLK